MLDDVQEPPIDKTTLKQKDAPLVCSIYGDGRYTTEMPIGRSDLGRLVLTVAAHLIVSTEQEAMLSKRVIAEIDARFNGFDPESRRAINTILGRNEER